MDKALRPLQGATRAGFVLKPK